MRASKTVSILLLCLLVLALFPPMLGKVLADGVDDDDEGEDGGDVEGDDDEDSGDVPEDGGDESDDEDGQGDDMEEGDDFEDDGEGKGSDVDEADEDGEDDDVDEEDDEDDDAGEEVRISLDDAIALARSFLRGKFGEGDYELVESEVKKHEYELVFRLDGNIFEVEVDAEDGEIEDYEAKFEELATEIEEEEDDEVEVRALERDRERSYHMTIAKNSTMVTLDYALQEEAVPDLSFGVRFLSLIEYLDTGITPDVYDDGDFVEREIHLSSLMWNVTSAELQNNIILVEQSSVDGPADLISLVYRASPLYSARVNGTMWRVKIEIRIDGFRWQRPLSYPAPNLALAIQLEPPFQLDLENRIVRFTEVEGVTPYFSWGGVLIVDGRPAALNVSAGQSLLYLSYPHFQDLIHDPEIGYIIPPVIVNILIPEIVGPLVLVFMILLAGISYARRRRLEESLQVGAG